MLFNLVIFSTLFFFHSSITHAGRKRGNKRSDSDSSSSDEGCPSIEVNLELIDQVFIDWESESVSFDSDNDLYWFGQRTDNTIVAMDATTHQFICSLTIESDDIGNPFGVLVRNGMLYATSASTQKILGFDISDLNNIEQSFAIDVGYPNSLCMFETEDTDATDDDILCYTDFGIDGFLQATGTESIWCIDLASDDLDATKILDSGLDMFPNGCEFYNDVLYSIGFSTPFLTDSILIECDFSEVSDYNDLINVDCLTNELWTDYRESLNDDRLALGNGIRFDKYGIGYIGTFITDFVTYPDLKFPGLLTSALFDESTGEFCEFATIEDDIIDPGDFDIDFTRDVLIVPEIANLVISFYSIDRVGLDSSDSDSDSKSDSDDR